MTGADLAWGLLRELGCRERRASARLTSARDATTGPCHARPVLELAARLRTEAVSRSV